jgi:hypothetical protein
LQDKEIGSTASLFRIWGDKRKKKDKKYGMMKWVSDLAKDKDKAYRAKYAEIHDAEVDPETEPFDPEVAMRAGRGKKHGRLFVHDGAVDPKTIPSLRQINRSNTSSSPAVEPHPTPLSIAIDAIRVCSPSLVIYTSFHVFHCNIHDLWMTQRRLNWRLRGHRWNKPRPSLLSISSRCRCSSR